jgi:hypothetical protein
MGPRGPAGPGGPGGPTGPGGPPANSQLQKDLAALRGSWQSGEVKGERGGATGIVKLHISPLRSGLNGRIRFDISTKESGGTTTAQSTHTFTLTQRGSDRLLVALASGRTRGIILTYSFDGDDLVLSGKIVTPRAVYNLSAVSLRRTSSDPPDMAGGDPTK